VNNEPEIEDIAAKMIGDCHCTPCLDTPNAYLGGQVPRDMLGTEEGRDLVLEVRTAIGYREVG
jgi:hypothetical protein